MSIRRAWPVGALATAGCLTLAFAVAILHGPATTTAVLKGQPVTADTRLVPDDPQFGDTVVATIDVVVDPRRADPRSVEVAARFAPFSITSSTQTTRRTGGLEVIRIVDRLDCLGQACLPRGRVASFRFPRLRVTYPGGSMAARWPELRVHSRLDAADLAHPMLRVDPPVAHPSYRVPPTVTGWALIAAAVIGAIAGLFLVVRAAAPSLTRARRPPHPIDELLAELARSGADGDPGRRRTVLERLACELEPVHAPLSHESRVLAWAPEAPQPAAISDLASRVRETVAR